MPLPPKNYTDLSGMPPELQAFTGNPSGGGLWMKNTPLTQAEMRPKQGSALGSFTNNAESEALTQDPTKKRGKKAKHARSGDDTIPLLRSYAETAPEIVNEVGPVQGGFNASQPNMLHVNADNFLPSALKALKGKDFLDLNKVKDDKHLLKIMPTLTPAGMRVVMQQRGVPPEKMEEVLQLINQQRMLQ